LHIAVFRAQNSLTQ